jgi:hypothetical protein
LPFLGALGALVVNPARPTRTERRALVFQERW